MNEEDNIWKEKYEVLKKEFTNLQETKTLSLMVGDLLLHSRKSLKGILTFPINLIKLRRSFLNGEIRPNINNFSIKNTENVIEDKAILFMATNGVGLGHLTRCLSVARKLKKTVGQEKIVFLTTCPALHLIKAEGFLPFYVPSKEIFEGKISSSQWDDLLMDAFNDVFSLYKFDTIIFDGAIPYQSLAMVLENNTNLLRIWIRRGSAKKQTQATRQKSEELFDYIIIPSEIDSELTEKNDKYILVEPIVYLDESEQMQREDVRKFFGVQSDKKLIYVQLGAGKINDTENLLNKIIDIILKDDKNFVVLGQSPLGNELSFVDERIIIIKDYPNAKFFKGFDFAISACGYNSFHELMSSGVPTVYLPNKKTGTDDQFSRAMLSEKYGLGVVLDDVNDRNLNEALKKLANINCKDKFLDNKLFNGSTQAAEKIIELRKGRC